MGFFNWDDCTFVFNSQTLTAYVRPDITIKVAAQLDEFHPMGAVWPTPVDTGLRLMDPFQIAFMYDGGGAATAPTACAVGTSSTYTLTIGALQTVSGTAIVSDYELQLGTDHSHYYVATFTPSGTQTTDFAA